MFCLEKFVENDDLCGSAECEIIDGNRKCNCPTGNVFNVDYYGNRKCIDIDECLTGILFFLKINLKCRITPGIILHSPRCNVTPAIVPYPVIRNLSSNLRSVSYVT